MVNTYDPIESLPQHEAIRQSARQGIERRMTAQVIKVRATRDNPNAEGHCDECPFKLTCELYGATHA